jgi:hypothetical protein
MYISFAAARIAKVRNFLPFAAPLQWTSKIIASQKWWRKAIYQTELRRKNIFNDPAL